MSLDNFDKLAKSMREIQLEIDRQERRRAFRRGLARMWRAFWVSFWRSVGWCVPILAALEWFLSRHHR